MRTMYASESPDYLFTDYGHGQLINGKTYIEIDPILSQNIAVDESHPQKYLYN